MSVAVEGPLLENKLLGPAPKVITVRTEPIVKRVRAFVDGVAIADSCRVMMMFETARLCVYYFPVEDVRTDLLVATSKVGRQGRRDLLLNRSRWQDRRERSLAIPRSTGRVP